jgi:hypothetical protein
MKRGLVIAGVGFAALVGALQVSAHHSFAVFFDEGKVVTATGEVKDFQLKNPHGVIRIISKDKNGKEQEWRAETNSPSILRRRGWTADILKVGETITIEGWPARDGSNYMRMRKVTRANGEAVGQPIKINED